MPRLGHCLKAVRPIHPPHSSASQFSALRSAPRRLCGRWAIRTAPALQSSCSPPASPTKMNTIWIWIPTGSKARNRCPSSLRWLGLEAQGDEHVLLSAYIWTSYNGFERFFTKYCCKYLCNWTADCILALSFLKLAHRTSALSDRGLFFSDLLTSCGRLRSSHLVLLVIIFNLAAWRPLSSKTRIPNAELAPQEKLHYIMFCLGWQVKQQYQGQKVLLKNWGCLFLEHHCFNNFV